MQEVYCGDRPRGTVDRPRGVTHQDPQKPGFFTELACCNQVLRKNPVSRHPRVSPVKSDTQQIPLHTPTDNNSTLCRMPNTFYTRALWKLEQSQASHHQES
ncbi:hypothetical protein IQ269_20025 [Tychonema sp. LEGE 07199]|uniref:hypothetical protein n=1 Tax=unclassified Tychonema TaxID=2642144 RepID=UPI0018828926|nr:MULTISPECIES: hypothetical protein [unclassified Tychonema]MBE9123023.1 hypothetical protein [Tychonema sp. LEGE 07199]MBE9131344.1 hypothetical protein [Tychonema sp. LEGE 07196]